MSAEPIQQATVQRFCDTFRPYGFDAAALCPAYGLAEHVCIVGAMRGLTFCADGIGVNKAFVADIAASASIGVYIVIADPESKRIVGNGMVGEIWVSSEFACHGYWQKPVETEAVFEARAYAVNQEREAGYAEPLLSDRRYLRTGDLGLIRDGRLLVLDRMKDVIIVRGRNCFSIDVEEAVYRSNPETFRGGSIAAFSVAVDQVCNEFAVLSCTCLIWLIKMADIPDELPVIVVVCVYRCRS